jgi:hypothetical protein
MRSVSIYLILSCDSFFAFGFPVPILAYWVFLVQKEKKVVINLIFRNQVVTTYKTDFYDVYEFDLLVFHQCFYR